MSSAAAMRTLYPELSPRTVLRLDVGDGHFLHVEDCGNAEGKPVIFLHGGPGSSCKPYHRQFFDPQRYRIILFDQRGCGRSQPAGSVQSNSTTDLLRDMEAIREALGVKRWMIFGGSWGATLGLLYAEEYPERISAMVLRGTFLARQKDLDWFLGKGAQDFYPEFWQAFLRQVPEAVGKNLLDTCHGLIKQAEDPVARERVARAWSQWGTRVVSFSLDNELEDDKEATDAVVAKAAIEIHYAANHYFISENQILNNIGKLPQVPVIVIHGRRDLTCLPEASWLVHRAVPGSRLVFIQRTGHLASEPATVDALVRATDQMLNLMQ